MEKTTESQHFSILEFLNGQAYYHEKAKSRKGLTTGNTRTSRKWNDSNGCTIIFHTSSNGKGNGEGLVSYTYTFWVRLTTYLTLAYACEESICYINTVQFRGDSSISGSSPVSATWYSNQHIWLVRTESTTSTSYIPCKELKR